MNIKFKPNTQEKPSLIILGILTLYFLISGFVMYFYIMSRISLCLALVIIGIFTIFYIPRFIIIGKLIKKDNIKLSDNCIMINNKQYLLSLIQDYRVNIGKPRIVFFMNNNVVLFQEAVFYILFKDNRQESFAIYGSEKITLLQKFFDELLSKKN